MSDAAHQIRPEVDHRMTRAEFERWYWPVSELVKFCERLDIPKSGRKAELRNRVAIILDGGELPPLVSNKDAIKERFDWRKATLTLQTPITDTITFGPKVRGFFKSQIGSKFVCHSDFMDWVKTNVGLTLGDAVNAWFVLEDRKDDPSFRREIAACNNYLQYLRDFRDANPEHTLDVAKHCWDQKKLRPAKHGFVIYEGSDLQFAPVR